MGNCTGCTGPQRKNVQVSRLQQGSPIKNRLSTSNSKSFFGQDLNYSFANKGDKVKQEKRNSQQLNFIGSMIGLSQKKQNRPNSMVLSMKKQQQFNNNMLSTILKNHIILHPDNPQMNAPRQQQLSSSFFMQKQKQNNKNNSNINLQNHKNNAFYSSTQDLIENSSNKKQKNIFQSQFGKNNNINTNFAESKYQMFQPPESTTNQKYSNKSLQFKLGESEIRGGISEQYGNNSMEVEMNALDKLDLSQIQINRQSSANKFFETDFKQSNSISQKKYSRYNSNLMVIQQLLNENNGSRTPIQVKNARKKNGQDIRYDHLQDLNIELEHFQTPNFSNYLNELKQIVQN